MALLRRYYCDYNGICYDNNYNSPWYSYGRWIVTAIIIVIVIVLFFLAALISARRRRRRGQQPWRGTGWVAGQPHGAPAPYYGGQPQGPPPPMYGAPPQGGPPAQGYFGGAPAHGQQNGVELASPPPTHPHGNDNVYAPPSGPPPGKATDGIIR